MGGENARVNLSSLPEQLTPPAVLEWEFESIRQPLNFGLSDSTNSRNDQVLGHEQNSNQPKQTNAGDEPWQNT